MSTKQRNLTAARMLGIKGLTKDSTEDEIRQAISVVLGEPDLGNDDQNAEKTDSYTAVIAKHGEEAIASATGAVKTSAQNIPNLSPTGVWNGKRARIRRVKTGHNDMGGAIFNWNGWPTIIPIDLDVDIAWPIYEIIQQCTGMEMEITQEEDPKNKARVRNVKNITYFDKYPYQFKGVTPGTEHLPESPWEYTLDMYAQDFPDFTVRMWRQLCILWEITDEQAKIKPGVGPEKEIETRRNAVHYLLNLPQGVEGAVRQRVRDEKRSDIGMKAA